MKHMFLRRVVHVHGGRIASGPENLNCLYSLLSQRFDLWHLQKGIWGRWLLFWSNVSLGIGSGSWSTYLKSKPPVPLSLPHPHCPSSLLVPGASWGLVVGCKGALPCTVWSIQHWSVGAWGCPSPSSALTSCVTLIKSLHFSASESPPKKCVDVGQEARHGEGKGCWTEDRCSYAGEGTSVGKAWGLPKEPALRPIQITWFSP